MSRNVIILSIIISGVLTTGCLAARETAKLPAETTSVEDTSEPTQPPEPAPAVTKATAEIEIAPAGTVAAPTETLAVPTASRTAVAVAEGATATPGATIMSSTASEGNADVEFVRAVETADGTWTFEVTVRHPDAGWEDYADGWDVVTLQGTVLKRRPEDPFTRLLLHPHETEQPFTRNQVGLVIPEGVSRVIVRAHDIVGGYGGQEVTVDLATASGPGFEVLRQ